MGRFSLSYWCSSHILLLGETKERGLEPQITCSVHLSLDPPHYHILTIFLPFKNIVDSDGNETSKWVPNLHLFVIMEEKASSFFRGTCAPDGRRKASFVPGMPLLRLFYSLGSSLLRNLKSISSKRLYRKACSCQVEDLNFPTPVGLSRWLERNPF